MIKQIVLTFTIVLLSSIAFSHNHAKFNDIVPGMVDGDIEQRAIKIANQRAIDLRCPEDYTKAVIISHKWKHELDKNGFVTGRVIHLELYAEFPEGKCGMADFIFKQKYTYEGGYSRKLFFVSMGDMFTVECEKPLNP